VQIHFSSLRDLGKYLETLDSIDVEYYAAINRKKGLTKVIFLPLNNAGSVHLGFTVQEFETLKSVIRYYLLKDKKSALKTAKFEIQEISLN
jgi:hypothetical protein